MDYLIRAIRSDEWEKVREIRLASLQDPVAHFAFLDTYEDAVGRPDSFWRERAEGGAEGGPGEVRQFVAEGPDGGWVGTITLLVERPAGEVRFGEAAKVDQTHVVGVYVRPGARGSGVIDALFRAGVEWSWALPGPVVERVRLYVHEDNARAAAAYRRLGFAATGEWVTTEGEEPAREVEYELRRPVDAGGCVVRAIRSDEWEKVRELRLAALRDPVAAIAFGESYEQAAARPDASWQERAAGGSEDRGTWIRQFVAEAADGRWLGTATVLVERPEDGKTLFGGVAEVPQTDVVGVYVRPEARGGGLVDALFRAALEWSWGQPEPLVERVRLFVHEDNARAAAVYRRLGFTATGGRAATLGGDEPTDLEYEVRRPAPAGER